MNCGYDVGKYLQFSLVTDTKLVILIDGWWSGIEGTWWSQSDNIRLNLPHYIKFSIATTNLENGRETMSALSRSNVSLSQ